MRQKAEGLVVLEVYGVLDLSAIAGRGECMFREGRRAVGEATAGSGAYLRS
jgi:hypothetical protein